MMGIQNNGPDEWERKFHTTFLIAANLFSNLYGVGQECLKQSFHDGERHSLENLRNWILDKGPQVTAEDIIAYIQNEIHNEGISQTVLASHYQLPPMHAHAPRPYNPVMPDETTVSAPNTIVGSSQQNNASLYHGESSSGHQSFEDDQGNEMETDAYFPEVTGHLKQSNMDQNSPLYSK